MRSSRTTALAMAGVLSLGLLAACSTDDDPSGDSTESAGDTVSITVAGLQPGAEQTAVDALNERVEQFEAKYPDIDVETQEYNWLASTFAADLAGGTLPDVFEVPATDTKVLIQNGQIADIDEQVKQLSYAGDFNPEVLAAGLSDDGKVYAVPAKSIYAVALHYNRKLFTDAGLDPDKPPTTWDEVRTAAKAITDATGVPGYAMMALDNAGGWQLTAAAYSRGGRTQVLDGDSYEATLTDPAVKESLEFLGDLKADGSLLANTQLGWGDVNSGFAAGQFAMYTSGSDIYTALVQNNGVTADNLDYGLTALPNEGDDSGTLGGGTYAAVAPQATDEEKDAAVKWIDFWYLSKLVDQDQAVADAKILAEQSPPQAVGTPTLPIFSKEQYETSLGWIEEYVNVPLDHMAGYTDVMFTQPVIPEAARATQETYGLLFPIVQAVMTDPGVDLDALLADANEQSQALIDQAG
ncbi:extracellular solute-binding protein [uncultured Cellulomonas sp.]|uniref:ABC transporter substrate-binding protein n=1 Tax=uncultured Cellulomonas sp. TaxID=189682 RepID=UPI0028E21DEE|nr:extracellular solute-binding protein [uncultured Cellulomonas sp.]